jgi:hypothetical protein
MLNPEPCQTCQFQNPALQSYFCSLPLHPMAKFLDLARYADGFL